MASSLSTDAHGVRVVTQIIPLQNPETVQCPKEKMDNKTKVPKTSNMTRMFLKGEPVALGTVQVLTGVMVIALGAIAWVTQTLYGEVPLGLGLLFIFSGSMTLVAHKGSHLPLIKSAIACNIISVLVATYGICYFCYALAIKPKVAPCSDVEDHSYYYDMGCSYVTRGLKTLIIGLKSLLLILSALVVCVSMTTVVFSCKAIVQQSGTKMGKHSDKEALFKSGMDTTPACEP